VKVKGSAWTMPPKWILHALVIDSEPLPPLATRLFFELCSRRKIVVDYGPSRYTVKKSGENYTFLLKQKVVHKHQKFTVEQLIEWLSWVRPVLRVIK
jgi:hypothetical protein